MPYYEKVGASRLINLLPTNNSMTKVENGEWSPNENLLEHFLAVLKSNDFMHKVTLSKLVFFVRPIFLFHSFLSFLLISQDIHAALRSYILTP